MYFQGGFFKVWEKKIIPKPPRTQPNDFSFEFKFVWYVLHVTPPIESIPFLCFRNNQLLCCSVSLTRGLSACFDKAERAVTDKVGEQKCVHSRGGYLSGGDRLVPPRAIAERGTKMPRGVLWGAGLCAGRGLPAPAWGQRCRSTAAHGRAPLPPPGGPAAARCRTAPGRGTQMGGLSSSVPRCKSPSRSVLSDLSLFLTLPLLYTQDGVPVAQVQLYCC